MDFFAKIRARRGAVEGDAGWFAKFVHDLIADHMDKLCAAGSVLVFASREAAEETIPREATHP